MRFAVLLLLLLAPSLSHATPQSRERLAALGNPHQVPSKVLGETRAVLVHVPEGYANSDARYPVIYLTDGPGHLLHTAGTMDFLAANGRMPRAILVAIANTDRTRDMTPTRASMTRPDGGITPFPTSGGADKFLDFFEKELFPFIENKYRTQPYRVFAGHSFGGLLAVHAFLEHTELFHAYLAVSPSLWWDGALLTKKAETFFSERTDKPLHSALYVTLGNEGSGMRTAYERFVEIVENRGDMPGFVWGSKLMTDEDHGSVVLRSHYHGLVKIFQPWQLPRNEEGLVIGGFEGAEKHFARLSKHVGFEMPVPEDVVNRLGYEALGKDEFEEALRIFRHNVEHFPDSPNVYDSLGDAYFAREELELARKSYARAVELARKHRHPNLSFYEANLKKASSRPSTD